MYNKSVEFKRNGNGKGNDLVERDVPTTRLHYWAMAWAMLFPSGLTWVYFVFLAEFPATVQQSAYGALKVIQFGFPLLWTICFFKNRLSCLWPWTPDHDLFHDQRRLSPGLCWLLSIGFGLFVAVSIFAGFWGLRKLGLIENQFLVIVQQKVSGMNLDTPLRFAAVGLFYSLAHSYLEEYYWRWFVYTRLRTMFSDQWANGISSFGFMLHHVILLGTFFGWNSPLTYVFSLGASSNCSNYT